MENKFITGSFLDATRNTDFHDKWMTADTWAALVAHHYQLTPSVTYDGKQLARAVNLDRRLTAVLDSTGEATEHTNVFRKWYKPKGSKSNIYCYYATSKGKKPNTESNEKWFTKITNARDLLEVKKTRSNILVFSSGITTPPQDNVNKRHRKGRDLRTRVMVNLAYKMQQYHWGILVTPPLL